MSQVTQLSCSRVATVAAIVGFISLLSGCEAVPIQPGPGPRPGPYSSPPPVYPAPYPTTNPYPNPPPPNYAYEEIRHCRADNQRAHVELVDLYDRARRDGRINPAEAQQFNAMNARINNMRAQLGRDGLTLQECQYINNTIANDRREVVRMSRYDPALARCNGDNRRAHDDIYAVYNDAQRAGRIRPGEAQRFQRMEKRLAEFQADVKRDGYTLADCQAVSRSLARERAVVEQMVIR